ncbi:MAG: prepilin-type N-terminal cleavage/methylation domain-containing protein [Oscillospiraceae bacterium]|nr:prepilin-type N-terminal cleavage/methylation domain-containing protein [Oscillospiraceae bacterium]
MNKIRKNKKGFTLIELIVVIVIIAILVAALTPAILGVINRANTTADEADCRNMQMAGSVAGMDALGVPTAANILLQFTGGANVQSGSYYLSFDGAICIGVLLPAADARGNADATLGDVTAIPTPPAAVAGQVVLVTVT